MARRKSHLTLVAAVYSGTARGGKLPDTNGRRGEKALRTQSLFGRVWHLQ